MNDWQELVGLIRDSKAFSHPERLDPNLNFQQQDLDSLDIASIFLAVEERYKIKVFAAASGRPGSFQDLLRLIDAGKRSK